MTSQMLIILQSYLPGQRLSACTCPGESHPGPVRKNGDYVGRSAPEIDIFEATIDGGVGKVSLTLSSYRHRLTNARQGFPIGTMGSIQRRSRLWLAELLLTDSQAGYIWLNTSDNLKIYDADTTVLNSYHGGMC
jgi:beta-glucan synthesis-associated protein KRE6